MLTRKLGRSNLEVTPLCLGTNVFGRTIDERTAFAVLDAYVAAGGNFIDTADIYSSGESEAVIGRWMKQRGSRNTVIIATKVGKPMAPDKIRKVSHARIFSRPSKSRSNASKPM